MSASNSSIFETIILESNDQKKSVDLRLGTVSIDYYEDIFSPTITAKVRVINTGDSIKGKKDKFQSIYNGLPLRGGERLILKLIDDGDGKKGLDFSSSPEKYLQVSSITDVITESQRESFLLNLVSREAITNETVRVEKKYDKGIHASVDNILKKILKTNRINEIEETKNPYSFIGNMRKPFSVLVWLASKSVPKNSTDSSAGFLFYQTQDGFNFKSIDALIDQKSKATYTYSEVQESEYENNSNLPSSDYKILSYFINKNQNLVEKLRLGAYSSQRMFFNPLDFSFTDPQKGTFQLEKYKSKLTNLGTKGKVELPNIGEGVDKSLGDVPTRILCSVIDVGTLDNDVTQPKDNADPSKYQAQSIMRYNMLMTQTISIMIPCNTNLRAGHNIECKFPKLSSNDPNEFDEETSGLYMIKELCHHFEPTRSYTSLKLIRDNFGRRA